MNIKEYWAQYTPAQRSMMMRERIANRKSNISLAPAKTKRKITSAGLEAIREAQRKRWREAKRAGGGRRDFSMKQARKSLFPVTRDNPTSIRARLEAIEAAVAQLKADIGL